jgi:hypothetical protein
MDTTTIIISALVGGLVSTISSTAIVWLNKYFDERRHRRELILKTAVESYAQYCQNAKDSGQVGKLLLPFADYVLLMTYLSEKSLDGSVNPSNVEQHLAEIDSLYDKMHDYRERTHKDKLTRRRI